MKNTNIMKLMLAAFIVLLLGAGVTSVSAKTLGEDFSIFGYNAGYFLLAIAVIIGVIFVMAKVGGVVGAKALKIVVLPVVILLVLGVALVGIQYEPSSFVPAEITSKCPKFKITATAVTTTGNHYIGYSSGKPDPVWDEDANTYTVPIDVEDASDGRLNESITALNFTIDPIATSDMTADTMATIHMSSDYDLEYSGEDVFEKDGSYYCVNWTSETGTQEYEDTQDMQISDTSWALCTWELDNDTAGNWVTELDAVGDSTSWHVTFWNDCNSWSETITVTVIVVERTA